MPCFLSVNSNRLRGAEIALSTALRHPSRGSTPGGASAGSRGLHSGPATCDAASATATASPSPLVALLAATTGFSRAPTRATGRTQHGRATGVQHERARRDPRAHRSPAPFCARACARAGSTGQSRHQHQHQCAAAVAVSDAERSTGATYSDDTDDTRATTAGAAHEPPATRLSGGAHADECAATEHERRRCCSRSRSRPTTSVPGSGWCIRACRPHAQRERPAAELRAYARACASRVPSVDARVRADAGTERRRAQRVLSVP